MNPPQRAQPCMAARLLLAAAMPFCARVSIAAAAKGSHLMLIPQTPVGLIRGPMPSPVSINNSVSALVAWTTIEPRLIDALKKGASIRTLAQQDPFRCSIRRNLANLPEWRPVLYPPPLSRPRRSNRQRADKENS
ncbi:hypothetical protein [Paraburkholderia youngii]|uniref:hypothetical protein n=1 Tax=Paraburkholderia youngii TaxID=2782701 RepID=UPI003D1C80F0